MLGSSDVSSPDSSNASTGTHLLQAFPTPVARLSYPKAGELNAGLEELVLSRVGGVGKEFGYKTESAGDLASWGDPGLEELTRWVGRMAGQLVEKLLGVSLAEAYLRSREREGEGGRAPVVGVVARRSWASVYRSGDRHEPHFHPNTAWSAIYYVAAPGPCELDLLDPRHFVDYFDAGISLAGEEQRVRLVCTPGDLVLIPGWLRHAVPTFRDEGVRISLSWNLNYMARSG
ncbi:hypothetical protein KVH23_33585 [Streptomyces olivaceus]|nr:hypothetical protein [Streptomyces olivaceus]MBZ6128303.1 hypothetical protein [Streptomyces olivaceus]MBZ6148854.1 hypothetical protein [Streptomyces olivaceus]MBZ6163067.1 hypothetical protein [Streptomyces olivaceus]MBZ6190871.1 hypothetical protein [Streptomyces olivaceus]